MTNHRPLVFDSSNLIYRNFHVMMGAEWMEKTADNLIDMMMKSFIKESRDINPTGVFSLWDFGRPQHRIDLCPTYKESRERSDDLIHDARDYLHDTLPKLGIVSVGCEQAEADDLAYLISHIFSDGYGRMVSTDYDWMHNMHPTWELLRPVNGQLIDWAQMVEWYGDHKTMEVALLTNAILGKGSNEVPGIYGVGEGTAIGYARKMILNEDIGDGKKATSVKDAKAQIDNNLKVMDLSWILTQDVARTDLKEATAKVSRDFHTKSQMQLLELKRRFKTCDFNEWRDTASKFNYDALAERF